MTLETRRVFLLPLETTHFHSLASLANEQEMWRYFTVDLSDPAILQQWIQTALDEKADKKRIPFVVVDKIENKVAGSMSIGNISLHDLRGEIGWSWLGQQYRGTGVNLHAKFAMLQYLFDQLEFERVEFKTDVLNERAKNGLIKLGAKQEGVLRSHMKMWNNRRRDSVYFSILKSEWQQLKRTRFKDIQ